LRWAATISKNLLSLLGFTRASNDLTIGRTEPITPSSVGAPRPITRACSSTWMTTLSWGRNSE